MAAEVVMVKVEGRTHFLAGTANWVVIVIEYNADLLHEPNLLFIVAFEIIGTGLGPML
jgi:hypothetical protein